MKKRYLLVLVCVLLLYSCTTQPSDSAIQTAIANTEVAQPTNIDLQTEASAETSLPIETNTSELTDTPIPTKTQIPTETPVPIQTETLIPSVTTTSAFGYRANPVPFGETISLVKNENQIFDLTVVEILHGDDAWIVIQKANEYFNEEAPEGLEYVLVKLSVNYKEGPADSLLELSSYDFGIVSKNNILDESLLVIEPEPEFEPQLFPGGICEGHIVKVKFEDDPDALLYYGRPGKSAYYFSLKR